MPSMGMPQLALTVSIFGTKIWGNTTKLLIKIKARTKNFEILSFSLSIKK
ncbi:hypothetical protein GCM10022291_06990 [Postechiella marina]|uniref:Uncharacterized protein n=1 Tax=Postechiella marina TaxID=943941 RepID=A0ABP8C293_9FLAO